MRTLASLLLAAALSPLSAYAGMYGDPVINLDAKSFKKAMATEHAAVSHVSAAHLNAVADLCLFRW